MCVRRKVVVPPCKRRSGWISESGWLRQVDGARMGEVEEHAVGQYVRGDDDLATERLTDDLLHDFDSAPPVSAVYRTIVPHFERVVAAGIEPDIREGAFIATTRGNVDTVYPRSLRRKSLKKPPVRTRHFMRARRIPVAGGAQTRDILCPDSGVVVTSWTAGFPALLASRQIPHFGDVACAVARDTGEEVPLAAPAREYFEYATHDGASFAVSSCHHDTSFAVG